MTKSKDHNPTRPTDPSYEIGRGKPPKHSRFKPGQSGNPGGRKKDSFNLKPTVDAIFNRTIVVTENGVKTEVTLGHAILMKQAQNAILGHRKSAEFIFALAEKCEDQDNAIADELPEEDRDILARAIGKRRLSRRHSSDD
jgi:hypothetical protein